MSFKVITSKQIPGNLEILTLEIVLDKKIPLMGLFQLNNVYRFFCTTYENITLIGDSNMITENKILSDFC